MARRVAMFALVALFGLVLAGGTWLAHRMQDIAEGVAAFPPREFDALTLVAVGTGGTYANPRRRGPCLAVGTGTTVVLVDAGRDVAEGLRASQIPVVQAGTVFLTDLLPENTAGLDDLLLAGWLAPRAKPLRVVGPPGTRALVEGLAAAHAAGIRAQAAAFALPPEGARFAVEELTEPTELEVDGLGVRAVPLPGGPLPTLAYRFEAGGRSIVAVGVAWGGDALVSLAQGASLLVQEAHFAGSVELAIQAGAENPERLRREAALRTPLEEAGRRATAARVRSLALVRLRPPPLVSLQATRVVGRTYRGPVEIPEDGDELTPPG